MRHHPGPPIMMIADSMLFVHPLQEDAPFDGEHVGKGRLAADVMDVHWLIDIFPDARTWPRITLSGD